MEGSHTLCTKFYRITPELSRLHGIWNRSIALSINCAITHLGFFKSGINGGFILVPPLIAIYAVIFKYFWFLVFAAYF